MALTVNERLQHAAVGHAVDLSAYSNATVARLIGLLNRTDADLFARLTAALEAAGESPSVDRLEQLLIGVRGLNTQAYQAIGRELTDELLQFARYEAGYQLEMFRSVIPAQAQATIGVVGVNVEQVYAAAMSQPFRGRLLAEWAKGIEATRMARVRDAVRIGFVEQQSIGEMVRTIRGTKAGGYADGLLEIDRREAEAVVRTAVSHTAGIVRDRTLAANAGIVKAVRWVSTLDSRTSELCRVRDTLRYGVEDHKPIGHAVPWLAGPGRLHWQCRSTSVAVVKSWREMGINIDDFSPSTRASMDGQVPADLSYPQWLAKQGASRQDEILGPTRGALLRQGGMTVEQFSNNKGRWLTLAELRSRDDAAFGRAGL